MNSSKGQLTLRGAVVGLVGCVVITAASVYTALKMGALPWPIIFAAIISLFFLKAIDRKRNTVTLNEANVTHTIMSAGAMVAGGLAFTIPGIWIIGAGDVAWWQILAVALAGVVMGLVCTAVLRRHFIEKADLEFPIGQAAAQTLIAGNGGTDVEAAQRRVQEEGAVGAAQTSQGVRGTETVDEASAHKGTGARLFGAMGFAGVFCFLRDALGAVPAMIAALPIPGVAFGIYCSPMLLSVGFLVGTVAVLTWIAGAIIGNFGLIVGGTALGWWDTATAQGIVSSLGMGIMMGAGAGVVVKIIVPHVKSLIAGSSSSSGSGASDGAAAVSSAKAPRRQVRMTRGLAACAVAACALIVCFVLGLGPVPAIIVVALTWITTAMSAQSVGQTGIDPMEIFGLIVLLAVAAVSDVAYVQLFFVAGVVSVACGLAGDVMNDFKAGHVLGTDPKAQWIGQALGAVVGAVVACAVMVVLVGAYGPESFGPGKEFVAAQASVVATMVAGIPSVVSFGIGLAVGFVLQVAGLPAMMLGLGVYLPFYMSFTAFLGMVAKLVYDAVCKARNRKRISRAAERKEACPSAEELAAQSDESGLVIASGLLGGESVIGVILALAAVAMGA